MSRANIETYYRLNYSHPVNKTPASDQLKEESIRLNRSTRNALQQSWDELESLQKEYAISTTRIAQHDDAIDEMRRKEKSWQGCCLIVEEKLREKLENNNSLQCNIKPSPPQRKQSVEDGNEGCCLIAEEKLREKLENNNSLQYNMKPSPHQRKQSAEDGNDEAKLQNISEQRGSSRYNKILSFPNSGRSLAPKSLRSLARQNDDQNELEFALKLFCRDEAISSLEQVLDENIESTQDLQAELQSLVVTHRMREKEIYDSHAKKEENFNYQVELLRKELSEAALMKETYNQRMENKRIRLQRKHYAEN